MIERTFLHAPGIGPRRELAIWRAGVVDWRDFLARGRELLPPQCYRLARPTVERSLEWWETPGGLAPLAARVPAAEHWRFLPALDRVVYLDIETGGDPGEWGGVTVVGLHDGKRVRQLMANDDLWRLNEALEGYQAVVTYGGQSFDLPVLGRVFGRLRLPPVRVDLAGALRRLGLTGGLKRVERRLGIPRPAGVEGLDGLDAVRLWREAPGRPSRVLEPCWPTTPAMSSAAPAGGPRHGGAHRPSPGRAAAGRPAGDHGMLWPS